MSLISLSNAIHQVSLEKRFAQQIKTEYVDAKLHSFLCFSVRHKELFLEDIIGPQVFSADYVQYAILEIQISENALWH